MSVLSMFTLTPIRLAAMVGAAARKHPALATRAQRAGYLIHHGLVQRVGRGLFDVASRASGKVYKVDAHSRRCQCVDHAAKAPTIGGAKLCKHIVAALFVSHVNGDLLPLREQLRRYEPRLDYPQSLPSDQGSQPT